MINDLIEKAKEQYDIEVLYNVSLSEYTTFRIGGAADCMIFPKDADSFAGVVRILCERGAKFITLGNGSNILFDDAGYRGAVIVTTKMKKIKSDRNLITAQAGASLITLAGAAREAGLAGLEFLYGIPGTVGGAVYMNAGAYGSEISDVLYSCRVYDTADGRIKELSKGDCKFSYRNSIFEYSGRRYQILDAVFELKRGKKDEIDSLMKDYMQRRREKQPLEYPSAGSAFKRAPGHITAKLIEEAGLKGCRVGGAQVSVKHAGFIINTGGATAQDVKGLIEHIKKTVYENFGVEIESEIRIV